MKTITSIFKALLPEPTPDEALIIELKEAVARVALLGAEAKARGITVWLKCGYWSGSDFFRPNSLYFSEAYKTTTKELG